MDFDNYKYRKALNQLWIKICDIIGVSDSAKSLSKDQRMQRQDAIAEYFDLDMDVISFGWTTEKVKKLVDRLIPNILDGNTELEEEYNFRDSNETRYASIISFYTLLYYAMLYNII